MSVSRPFPPFKPRSRNLNEILVRNPQKSWNCRTFTKGSKAPGDRIEFHLLLASITLQDLAVFQSSRRCYENDLKFQVDFFFDGAFCLWNCLNSYMHFCAPTSILRWFLGGTWMVHSSSKFPLSPMCVDTSQKKNIKAWCVFKPSILHTSKMPYKPHTSATSPRRWLNDGNGFFAPKGCNESPKQIHIFCCTLCWKRRNIQSNICKKTKYLQME